MLLDIEFNVSTQPVKQIDVPLETYHSVQQFLYREARLLDTRQWQPWLDLWTEDGMYWIPRKHQQASPFDHISICWDNDVLREVRMRTLENQRNWAQQPITYTSRVIGNVMIDGADEDGCLIVHSTFHITEWRKETQRELAGSYTHKLAAHEGGWRIKLKRIDLVNCSGVLGPIQVYL